MLVFAVFAFLFTLQCCNSICQTRQRLTDTSGYITDDLLNDYTDDITCVFLISLSNSSSRILLSFNLLNTECGWDYLTVFDGRSYTDPILMSISGDLLTGSSNSEFSRLEVVSSTSEVLFHFKSDQAVTASGFYINYTAIHPSYTLPTNTNCNAHCYDTCYLVNGTLYSDCNAPITTTNAPITTTNAPITTANAPITTTNTPNITTNSVTPYAYINAYNTEFNPEGRAGHTSVVYQDCLYVYGGYTFRSQYDEADYSIYRWCNGDNQWVKLTPVSTSGPFPYPRYGHSAVIYGNSIYIYGGTLISYRNENYTNEITNEMWRFNLDSKTWTYLSSSNRTLPSTGHTAHIIPGARIVVLFGMTSKMYHFLQVPREYDITRDVWKQHNATSQNSISITPLAYCSSVYSATHNLIFAYGGYNTPERYLYTYDPDLQLWSQASSNGNQQLYLHAMEIINDTYIVVVGGTGEINHGQCEIENLHLYDIRCDSWKAMSLSPDSPAFTNRMGHSLTNLNNRLVMFGGYNRALLFNDLLRIEIPNMNLLYNVSTCHTAPFCHLIGCNACLANIECSWDFLESTCVYNTLLASNATSNNNLTCPLPEEDNCQLLTINNCVECQIRQNCMWIDGDCRMSNFSVDISTCPQSCSGYSCEVCFNNVGCLYCPSQNRCTYNYFPAVYPFGQCLGWAVSSDECGSGTDHVCNQHYSCDSCHSNFICGWCEKHSTGLGGCIEGDSISPLNAPNCSLLDWHYYTCPMCQCNGHSACEDNSSLCSNCSNNTTGEHCELCIEDYYGNPMNGNTCTRCTCVEKYTASCDNLSGDCNCNTYGVRGNRCDTCQYNGTTSTSCYKIISTLIDEISVQDSDITSVLLFKQSVSYLTDLTVKILISPDSYTFIKLYRADPIDQITLKLLELFEFGNISSEIYKNYIFKNYSDLLLAEYNGDTYQLIHIEDRVLLVTDYAVINNTFNQTLEVDGYTTIIGGVVYTIKPETLNQDNRFLFIEFLNFTTPILFTITFESENFLLMVVILVFLSSVLIFFIILVVILLAWHIKKQLEFRRIRVHRRRERNLLATRPLSNTDILAESLTSKGANYFKTRPIAVQPLAGGKASLYTILISMPSNPDNPTPIPLYCATALVSSKKNSVKDSRSSL